MFRSSISMYRHAVYWNPLAILLGTLFLIATPLPAGSAPVDSITLDLLNIPGHPVAPDGSRFIPVGCPVEAKLSWPESAEKGIPHLRIADDTGNEISRIDTGFPVRVADGRSWMEFLLIVPPLEHSQFVRFEAAPGSPGAIPPDPSSGVWRLIRSEYALMRSFHPRFAKGWHPFDPAENASAAGRWSMVSSTIEMTDPVRPMLLRVAGTTNPSCLPGGRIEITLSCEDRVLTTRTVTSPEFEMTAVVSPLDFNRNPLIGLPAVPLMNSMRWLLFSADQFFVPSECLGTEDNRKLSFSVRDIEYANWLPDSGFHSRAVATEPIWSSPRSTLLIPGIAGATRLLIQGVRDIRCMPEPQTLRISIGGKLLLTETVATERFCLQIPLSGNRNPAPDVVRVDLTVEPLFFRSQCSDSADPEPFGVAIQHVSMQ